MLPPFDDSRRVKYPLNRTASPVGDVGSDSIASDPFEWASNDSEERVTITLELSLQEYIALSSAIDVGRDIAYNNGSIYIWYLWVRSINTMPFCEQVNNCIETSVSTQSALRQNAIEGGFAPDNRDYGRTGAEALPNYASEPVRAFDDINCDLDALWAGIREIVGRLDAQTRDFLEELVTLNDRSERFQGVIDLVPVVGDFLADLSDFFTETIPDLLNAFNAYSDPATLDNIACDIFEIVCDECRYPTVGEIYGLLLQDSIVGLPDFGTGTQRAVWELVRLVSTGTPSVVWYTFAAWQTFTLYFDNKWVGGYGKNTFNVWGSFGEDLPNDNWITLCNGCNPVGNELVINFSGADTPLPSTQGVAPDGTTYARNTITGDFRDPGTSSWVYTPPIFFASVNLNPLIELLVNMPASRTVTRVEVDFIGGINPSSTQYNATISLGQQLTGQVVESNIPTNEMRTALFDFSAVPDIAQNFTVRYEYAPNDGVLKRFAILEIRVQYQ